MTKTAHDFPHKRLARIESTMLGIEGHGILTAMLHVTYGGSMQGVGGLALDEWSEKRNRRIGHRTCGEFILGVLRACGVDSWERVKGRTLFVLLDSGAFQARPVGLAPLPTEPGEVFLFDELKEPV